MRHRQEGHVGRLGNSIRLGQGELEVAGTRKGGVDGIQARAGLLAVGGHGKPHVGVAKHQAADLDARKSRGADDADPYTLHLNISLILLHNYECLCSPTAI